MLLVICFHCIMEEKTYSRHKWSAPYLIFVVLIVLQSLSVGIIMLKQHGMGEEILLTHARDMMRRLADGAIYNTRHHLQAAENAARITSELVRANIISSKKTPSFEKYLLQTLDNYSEFSGLSYGNNQGNFVYVARQSFAGGDGYLTKLIYFENGEKQEEIIQRDADLEIQSRRKVIDDFDPRTRPWYAAVKHQKLIWTSPYIFYTSRDPGITVSIPITNNDKEIGAFGVDIEINSLSDFLAHRKISPKSSAFIVANDGAMAAHSNIDLIKRFGEDGQARLINIVDIKNDPVTAYLWTRIKDMEHSTLQQGSTLDFSVEGEKYLAVVRSFPGNSSWPWIMTVVAPENDFIGIFRKAKRQHLLQALVYSIGITLLLFFLAGRFLKPVRRLLHYAHFDPMTDLYNRRGFFESSGKIVSEARAKKTPLCLAMADVDNFKAINDTYGHSVGDELLVAIAGRLRGALDDRDLIGRYGGEEFILLLAGADSERGVKVCERLRKAIGDSQIQTAAGLLNATVSIGVSPLFLGDPNLQITLNQADHALLRAKSTGKNRVVLSG